MIDKILKILAEKGGEAKAGEVKLSPAAAKKEAIARLIADGLVDSRKEGRSEVLRLTEAGRERAPAVAAPRDLGAQLDRIEAALARLEARLAGTPDAGELKASVLAVIAEVDAARRYGGLVPLPDLRHELRRRGVAAGDAQVNAVLEELERDYVIDLSIAQSPTAVADRAAGIERPGRGLAYYVVRRQA